LVPGLIDLAALTSGDWTEEKKEYDGDRFIARHWCQGKAGPPSMDDLMEGIDYCQLHLSIQLLGWAFDWSPPRAARAELASGSIPN